MARGPTPTERALLCRAMGLSPAGTAEPLPWPRPDGDRGTPEGSFLIPYARAHLALPAAGHAFLGTANSGREEWAEAAIQNEFQNRVLLADLRDIATAFQLRRIPFIVLKGAALMARYPRLVRLRHTDDIDIWVDPRRLHDANTLLLNHGYRDLGHSRDLSNGSDHHRHLRLLVSARGTPVELHRRPPDYGRTALFEEAWQAAERVALGDVEVPTRHAPAMLVDLCAHVVLHHFAQAELWPRHLVDVATMTAGRPELFAVARARATPLQRGALWLTERLLAELRQTEGGGFFAHRLVFPARPMEGRGWYELALLAWSRVRSGPGALGEALLPSEEGLRRRGYGIEAGLLRARMERMRAIVARASGP